MRKGLLPKDAAAGAARDWATVFEIRAPGREAHDLALAWWADGRLSYWDAMLVATASAGGAACLVSEDLQDGAVAGGVEIVNPFAEDRLTRLAPFLVFEAAGSPD